MSKSFFFRFIAVGFLVFISYSCINPIAEVKNWMEAKSVEEIIGKYHFLDNDGIKVYLPQVFERYSSVEYQQLLDSLATEKQFEFESKRLKSLREMEGSFYIFFDADSRSTFTINTLPYMPITRSDAQYLLGMISVSNDRTSYNSDLNFTKLSAVYHGSKDQHIFKSIYRIDNDKTDAEVYNSTYIISSNHKTVWIQLTTPFEADFDMFIQKLIM